MKRYGYFLDLLKLDIEIPSDRCSRWWWKDKSDLPSE